MNRLSSLLRSALVVLLMSSTSYAWRANPYPAKPLVQVAILLDTSNSMDGLIEQAKSQLWRITNDLAYASRYGQRPTLQIALYEYGNNALSSGENWIRQVLPFTTDMDLVSERLFSLRTNGGQEYCGAVIKDALNSLRWDSRDEVYKVMFIAGNEPFTQGPVYFRDALQQANRQGVIVNTIFCGSYAEGTQTQWYDGAIAGRGAYVNIDSHRSVVVDPTPYDDEIGRLGGQINETYVGYGARGLASKASQASADRQAAARPEAGSVVERSIFKASPQYAAAAPWDAVSGVASGRMKVAEMKTENLPSELQGKNQKELEAYFKDQQDKRAALQNRLSELKTSREDYLAKKQREQVPGSALSLDQAMRKVIREQAGKLHFSFGGAK